MISNKKYIISYFLFLLTPIIINNLLPTIGNNNIIDLILRLTINALMLLTFIYLFYFEIEEAFKNFKKNKKDSFKIIILYVVLLLILFILIKIFNFININNDKNIIIKYNTLYKQIPTYLFINNILLIPLIDTITLRYSINKYIKNKYLFLILSISLSVIYYLFIIKTIDIYLITSLILLSLVYLKDKNIITTFITNIFFSLIIFLINYF